MSKGKVEGGALVEVEDHSIWSILRCLEREGAGAERVVQLQLDGGCREVDARGVERGFVVA